MHKKLPYLGIELHADTIKHVALSQKEGKYTLENYKISSLNFNAEFNTASGLRTGAAALHSASLITKMLRFERGFSASELESQIFLNIENYLPYPASSIEELSIDLQVLGPDPADPAFDQVLVVAARTKEIDQQVSLLAAYGIVLKVVEPAQYAIERVFRFIAKHLPEDFLHKTIAMVYGGPDTIQWSIIQAGKIIHAQEPVTSNDLEQCLSFKPEHLFLTGSDINLNTDLAIPITIADPFAHMKHGLNIKAEQLKQDSQKLILACGLALRSFEP